MKKSYIKIFILSFLLNLSESLIDVEIKPDDRNENIEINHCSQLIEMVNKENVDKALIFLPKKEYTDILKMLTQMIKAQEDYSLNEVDSAYLAFKWIVQNIKFEGYYEGNEDITKVYNSGKGNPAEISSLFNRICNYLNIESDSISGNLKSLASNEFPENPNSTWNYIVINDTYYLVHASFACIYSYSESDMDMFFGTYPEIFIRYHFPKESKWQLLSKPYTRENFDSMICLFNNFYLYDFKTISPDSKEISIKQKITLTYNDSFPIVNITYCVLDSNFEHVEEKAFHFSNGKAEAEININNEKAAFISLWFYPKNSRFRGSTIGIYELKHSEKKIISLNSKIP